MHIHIVTDSAADIRGVERKDLTVLPMTIGFGEEAYRDGVDLTHAQFYEKLVTSEALPVTSQINPFAFREVVKPLIAADAQVVIITMSSKLSGTFQSAASVAAEYPDRVFAVDSENVTLGERILVDYALALKDAGQDAAAIASALEQVKKRVRIAAVLDTLEYLKKGGRISKTVAFAGGILQMKPLVGVRDGAVVMLGKARGETQAGILLRQQIQESGRMDFTKSLYCGYTGLSDDRLRQYMQENIDLFGGDLQRIRFASIGGTIGTHVGPGAMALAWCTAE